MRGAVVGDGAAPVVTLVDGEPEFVVAPPRAGVELPAGAAVSATCGSRTLEGELTDEHVPWVASEAEAEGEGAPKEGRIVETLDDRAEALGASCAATAAVAHGDEDTVWVPSSALRAAGVSKRFGGRTVLDGFALTVGRGEFVALTGPSGS